MRELHIDPDNDQQVAVLADAFCYARWSHVAGSDECDPLTFSSMRQALTTLAEADGPLVSMSVPAGTADQGRSVLAEAEGLVNGQRAEDYGDALTSFTRIAALWSVVLGVEVTAHQVVLCMVQLKVSRAMQGWHRDSYVDIAGYAACAEQVQTGLENAWAEAGA